MSNLYVTPLLAAALALALVALSFPVSLRRMKAGVVAGDGGDEVLRRRIRAQGNFIEYAPLGLIVVALLELGGAAPVVVWSVAGALALGRLSHAAGMLSNSTPLRAAGMMTTYASLLAGAGFLLALTLG